MKITTIFDEEIDTPCAGCIVTDNSKFKEGRIYQTKLWDISQDFEIAYPGMIVLSLMRHVSNYMDLTEPEIQELNILLSHCKKAISEIFNSQNIAYMFYEKPNGHIHFVIIPLHGLVEVKDKYSVLGELMAKSEELRTNKETISQVISAVSDFRRYFKEI